MEHTHTYYRDFKSFGVILKILTFLFLDHYSKNNQNFKKYHIGPITYILRYHMLRSEHFISPKK